MRTRFLSAALAALLGYACSSETPAPHPSSGDPAATGGATANGGSTAPGAGVAGTPSPNTGGGSAGTGTGGAAPEGGRTGTGTGATGGAVTAGTDAGGATNAGAGGTSGASNPGGSSSGGAPSAGASGDGGTTNAGAPSDGGGTTNAGASGAGGTTNAGAAGTGGIPSPNATTLAAKYANHFSIGAAVDSQSVSTHADLLRKHFNSITPENEMKFESLQPNEGNFTFGDADRIVDFATRNGMQVRGHALVWHTQNPSWLFSNGSGGTVSREVLLARMRSHINTVMRHFQGKVYAWDVVNEAIMEDGSYRDGNEEDGKQSRWYQILGESYVAEAFKAAHEADPDAKLFYNDFYNYIPAKHQGIYEMLKGLLEQGVPVHGVGLQCHINIEPSTDPSNQAYYQSVANLEDAIELYASLGLEVQVTELDVSLYVPGMTYTPDTFYTAATFTEALQTKQAERYREFFELFRRHADAITNVTFWGIADDNTWLSEFSSGRKDFPLLFDGSHQPKKAFDAVMDF